MRRRGKTARSTISGNDFSGGCLPTRGSLPRSLRLDAAADAGRIIRGAVRHNGIAPIALAFGSVGIGPQGPSARRTPQYSSKRPGGPGRLPARGSHRSVLAHMRAYGSRLRVTLHRARLASRCWSGSPGRAFTRRVPIKGFQLTSCSSPSFSRLLGTIPFSVQLREPSMDGRSPRLPRNRRRSVPFPGRSGRSLDHRLLQKRELQWPEAWHSSKWANRAGRTGRFHANQGPRRRETRIPL